MLESSATRVKARTVVGRGKGLLSDPGSELRLSKGMEKEKGKVRRKRIERMSTKISTLRASDDENWVLFGGVFLSWI